MVFLFDGIFGIGNAWIDAFIRLNIVVAVMTVIVMGLIYLERKFVARIQMRLGPMRTGKYGSLQSIADAIKLLTKEDVRPASADTVLFELATYVCFVPAFITLLALPFTEHWGVRDLQLGLFYIIAVSGVSVIGYITAGWASDNKYALLGAVRSAAQLVSYEIPLILGVLSISIVAGSLNLREITLAQYRVPNIVIQPLPFVIIMTAILAELSRRPFDIPIGESELVGGPWVEFSGIRWSILFALTEYASLWGLSILASLLFLGGWEWPFGHFLGSGWNWAWQLALTAFKSFFVILVVMWIGASFPRLRIDQLMNFCWKILLPFGFLQVLVNGIVRVYVDDVTARDIIFGASSLALLIAMGMVIVRATKVPSREERMRTIYSAPSVARRRPETTGSVAP